MDRLEETHLRYDVTWVDFSLPRPRASVGGTFSRGAMMEGTHDDDDVIG